MKDELLHNIEMMIDSGKIYVHNTLNPYMEIRLTGVEVDPDGDIKLIAEITD